MLMAFRLEVVPRVKKKTIEQQGIQHSGYSVEQ